MIINNPTTQQPNSPTAQQLKQPDSQICPIEFCQLLYSFSQPARTRSFLRTGETSMPADRTYVSANQPSDGITQQLLPAEKRREGKTEKKTLSDSIVLGTWNLKVSLTKLKPF